VLTPNERQLIETAYFAELTYAEVAVRLDQPLGTVKTRIRSGLAKFRQALQEAMSDVSDISQCDQTDRICLYALRALPASALPVV